MEAKMEFMKWFRNRYISEEDVEYLRGIVDDDDKIEELFGTDLAFEGNKLEGKLGIGPARMNNYQVCRAVQAYCSHLIRLAGGHVEGRVAIGYDTRSKSTEWSDSVARILLGNGIGTSLFQDPKSIEQLSFAINYLRLEGGIMLTADEDDPQLYGIKFFNKQGEPMDEEEMIGTVLGFQSIQDQSGIKAYAGALRINSIHRKIGISNDTYFIQGIQNLSVNEDVDKDLKIAYSPLYGAGAEFIPRMFEDSGYKNVYTVKKEMAYNGDFPGLERPDPSDERVYAKVLEKAKNKDADVAIVSNPNVTEFGAAVKTGEGEYRILPQEELKAMLEEYKAGFTGEKPVYTKIPGPSDIFLFVEMMAYNKKNGK